jgi:two-component system, response regulator
VVLVYKKLGSSLALPGASLIKRLHNYLKCSAPLRAEVGRNQEFPDLCSCAAPLYIAPLVKSANGKIEIVLVEDKPADTELMVSTLKKANISNRLHILKTGADILEFLLRKGPYSAQPPLPGEIVILLSLNLEGIHGLDVLRKLKSDERTRSLPVIILTSSQEERGVMQSYKLGANACIVKPVDLRKLIEAVAELRLGWLLTTPEDGEKGADH